MGKYWIIALALVFSINLNAQYKNHAILSVGKIYFTDWEASARHETGISYTRIIASHLSIYTNISYYYCNDFFKVASNNVNLPYGKEYFEGTLSLDYYFNKLESKIELQTGLGISFRNRSETFYLVNDIGDFYRRNEIGLGFHINSNYNITKRFSLGIYGIANLFPTHIEEV